MSFVLGMWLQPATGGPVLRDIHQPAAPPWWPPAPGWWMLALVALCVAAAVWWWHRRRVERRERIAALFDDAVDAAVTPAAQMQVMSELLRRAARRMQANADTLEGEAWLRFLDDGLSPPSFVEGVGRVLVDGAFRPQVSQADADALRDVARARFLSWMARG